MAWESIATIIIMFSCLAYGVRCVLLIRKINTGLEKDYIKQEKVAKVISNIRVAFILGAAAIIILLLSVLIRNK